MRLIDADKAERRIEQFLCGGCDDYHNCIDCLANKALSLLRGEQTIDAVEVVRCKDCRSNEHEQPGMVWCRDVVGSWMPENGFCSYGKKRRVDT